MTRSSITLRLAAEPHSVALARAVCRTALQHARVDEDRVLEVVLALSEACANAVEHAVTESYAVRIDLRGSWCRIEVDDDGRGFDVSARPQEPPPEHAVRGRGIVLMHQLVDELVVSSRQGAGTRVLLAKHVAGDATPPDHDPALN